MAIYAEVTAKECIFERHLQRTDRSSLVLLTCPVWLGALNYQLLLPLSAVTDAMYHPSHSHSSDRFCIHKTAEPLYNSSGPAASYIHCLTLHGIVLH